MSELIRLRDLPGIAQVEAMVRSRDAFAPANVSATMERVWEISISLFSLCDYHTEWNDDWSDHDDPIEYEAAFLNVLRPYSEARPFWEALGWDISDGAGHELGCAHFFGRQIIALKRGDFENARFTLDGSGTFCWDGQQSEELDEEQLEARLKREADDFLAGRFG